MLRNLLPTMTPSQNGTPNPARLSFLDWLAKEDATKQSKYQEYRDYYEGNHRTQLTSRMRSFLQIGTDTEFNGNYCPIVVDALAERLKVIGFDAGDHGGMFDDKESAGELVEWWKRNRMDEIQIEVHNSAIRDGDTFIITEYDNDTEMPCFTHELAYDGREGVKVHYRKDKRRQIAFASKRWRVESEGSGAGTMRRLNIYTEDAIYKYIDSDGGRENAWIPYEVEGEDWPLEWKDKNGNPLGVPVFHFRNNAKGYEDGISEIDKVIPQQNALNKSLIDLLASADTTAFRIFTMTGADPTSIDLAPGSWVYSEDPDSSIGVIDGMDMRPMIAVVDSFVTRIAQISRTPLSYFQASKQVASGDTQRANDSGLVSKAIDRSVSFGNTWEDVMGMAAKLHNTFGNGSIHDDTLVNCLWDDFEVIDQMARKKEQSEVIANLTSAGASLYTAARAAGMSEAEALALMQTDVPDTLTQ